eukprot:scaffold101479_cov36-Cyclotella_meneghiniana.AAC.1
MANFDPCLSRRNWYSVRAKFQPMSAKVIDTSLLLHIINMTLAAAAGSSSAITLLSWTGSLLYVTDVNIPTLVLYQRKRVTMNVPWGSVLNAKPIQYSVCTQVAHRVSIQAQTVLTTSKLLIRSNVSSVNTSTDIIRTRRRSTWVLCHHCKMQNEERRLKMMYRTTNNPMYNSI